MEDWRFDRMKDFEEEGKPFEEEERYWCEECRSGNLHPIHPCLWCGKWGDWIPEEEWHESKDNEGCWRER